MKKFIQTILLFLLSTSVYANIATSRSMVIESGIWEGIDREYQGYKILELASDGEHRLWRTNIAGDFQTIHYLPFSHDDIDCENNQCQISIADPRRGSVIRLVITPSYTGGPLTVLEKDTDDEATVATTYELRKKEGQSTYRDFWDRHRTRLQNIKSTEKIGLSGFWVGTLAMDNEVNLMALDMPYQSRSQFIRYLSFGKTPLTNETTFESSDIEKIGDAMFIKTSHKTFANQILIHRSSENTLVGHIYSYHKGNLLQTGEFRAKRID